MASTHCILLIEDDLAHAELIKRSFDDQTPNFTLHQVPNLAEAYRFLAAQTPALVLSDFRLPDGEGTELLPTDRHSAQWPVIIMTSQGDEQLAVEALKAGALDYVVKSEETFINMPRIVERALREWNYIIERRLAETNLRRREHQLTQAQKFAKFGSWEFDLSTKIFELSDEGYQLFGMEPVKNLTTLTQLQELFKKHLNHDLTDFFRDIETVIKTKKIFLKDAKFKLPNGTQVYLTEQIHPVFDAQKEVQSVIGIIQDITERKQAEEAQKTAEQELETQRTLSMRSDRLRSLGEMSAGIAHELNQPLMGVRGLAEHILIAIQRGWDLPPDKLEERAQKIIEQADRMTHIIEHIRMFSREAGNPECQPTCVNKVVASAVEMLDAQFRSHGLVLETNYANALSQVSANPFSLEEVLLNLIVNARDTVEEKASQTNRPYTPQVTVQTLPSKNDSVLIQVQDNGLGIPQAIINSVFDPFFTTKAPDKGTGLGLSISKSIIESFNGQLEIQSVEQEGTTICITLPIIEMPAK